MIDLPSRTVSTIAGTGSVGSNDGPALTARFNFQRGVAYDGGNNKIYVADTGNNRIRLISM
jgi:DNA-binding beta-propeller fold protein YncE